MNLGAYFGKINAKGDQRQTIATNLDSPLVAVSLLVPGHLHVFIALVFTLFSAQGCSGLGECLSETVEKLLTPVGVDEGDVIDDKDVIESREHIKLISADHPVE